MIGKVFTTLLAWLAAKLGVPGLLALVLLLTALTSVAMGLANVIQGLDVWLLLLVTALSLLIGWGLAASPLPGWLAGPVSLILGIEAAVVRIGNLERSLAALVGMLMNLAWQTWRWPQDNRPPNITPLLQALAELAIRVMTLLTRLFDWLAGVAIGEPTFDPAAAALVWALALWAVAAWASWLVRRHNQPLPGMLPAGALLVVSQSYGGGNFVFLLLLLGITWLLMALVVHAARERHWQVTGTDYALDIRVDLTIVVIWLAAALVTVAALAPLVSIRQVAEAAQRLIWGQPIQAGPVARSLGLQPQSGQSTAFDKVRIGGLPRQHLLGSGPELSQQVVMIIQAGTTHLPGTIYRAGEAISPARYYWRSLVYDRYTGYGWLTGKTDTVAYNAGEPVSSQTTPVSNPVALSQHRLEQQVQIIDDVGGLLHVAGTLVAADQPYQVAWRSGGDAFGATIETSSYQAVSMVPAVTEAELRATRGAYPEVIRNRYLALPDEVPARVLALARNLTATEPSGYDRARAIETYLRTFPYDLNLPAPPSGQDVADYFLFDLQRGYCDYYATAMVVLARAAGLPARLVVGYASGTYSAANERYIVTQADAHAWPEIYFSGYGWIEFEPTAARPPLERSAETAIVPPEVAPALPLNTAPVQTIWNSWWWLGLAVGVAALFCGAAIWTLADNWWLRHLPPAATVEQLYQRLRRHGYTLVVPVVAGDTPYEFSASLARRLSDLPQSDRWRVILSPAAQEAQGLADLYVRLAYSAHRLNAADQTQAVKIWQRLRWRLWLAYVGLMWAYLSRSQPVNAASKSVLPDFPGQ